MEFLGARRARTMPRWTEKLKGQFVKRDKDFKDKLETEEHVPVPKREREREELDECGFTARCPGCMSLLWRAARQAHT